jgi:hypothetical protein
MTLRRSSYWLAVVVAAVLGQLPQAKALGPDDAPPLPPAVGAVQVSTAQQLINASCALVSGQTIEVLPGTYDLSSVSPACGANYVVVGLPGNPAISNVAIRGSTGDPDDVVITGAGMAVSSVPHGIQIFTATDVLLADLTIRDVYYHGIDIVGSSGASSVHMYHVRVLDTGQQPAKADGADDGILEYSEIGYTSGAPDHPEFASCYTGGLYIRSGSDWSVRDNLFRRIICQDQSQLAAPAVLVWQSSSGTVVERNAFLDGARGVSLGLMGGDHTGGIVRNNFVRSKPGDLSEVGIFVASAGARVLHNTVLLRGNYPYAIEARWALTTGVEVRNNLLDGTVFLRDGASATQSGNVTSAQPEWFVDEASGDLHLDASATAAIDQVTRLADAVDDFDASDRPSGSGEADIGGDEWVEAARVPSLSGWAAAMLGALLICIVCAASRKG